MGAAASILAVGVVILIVGAAIYYMTYTGKLSINKTKSSPNTRPPNGRNGRRCRNGSYLGNGPRIQPVNGNERNERNGVSSPTNGRNERNDVSSPGNGRGNGVSSPTNGRNGRNGVSSPGTGRNGVSSPTNGRGNGVPRNGLGVSSTGPAPLTTNGTVPPQLPVNGNRIQVNGQNGNPSNNGRISPRSGNSVRIQPVNGVQNNRGNERNGVSSPGTGRNGQNGVRIQPTSPRFQTNGQEFFVQLPTNGNVSGNGSVNVTRGVRIETTDGGINVVPVNEVNRGSSILRCEEVSIM